MKVLPRGVRASAQARTDVLPCGLLGLLGLALSAVVALLARSYQVFFEGLLLTTLLVVLLAAVLRGRERQRRVHAEQARFAAIVEHTNDAVVAMGAQGQVTAWNPGAARLFGRAASEVLGRDFSELLPPDERSRHAGVMAHVLQGDVIRTFDQVMLSAAGQLIDVSVTASAIRGRDGGIVGVSKLIRDIRERKLGERRLLDFNARLEQEMARRTVELTRTQRDLRAVLDAVPFMVGYWTRDLINRVANHAYYSWFGLASGSLQGMHMRELLGEQRFEENRPFVEAALRGEPQTFERVMRSRHGPEEHHALVQYLPDVAEGVVCGFYVVVTDITDITRSRRVLAEKHEMLRVTLMSIGDAVITTDASGLVDWLNPVAQRMTGWSAQEAHGLPLATVFHIVNEETRAPAFNPVETCLREGRAVGLANHTVLIAKDGREYAIEDSASPIRDEQGTLFGVVLVFHDVTAQRSLSNEMSFRASHDALTGLVNRTEFDARLRRVLRQAKDERVEHALMFIDLDQFKLVNDACGHSAGDQLLQQVGRLLTDVVRNRDTLARLGGDEFAVILEHCSADQALRLAQAVCDRMDEFRFVHDGRRFRIGASIGLVAVDSRWRDLESLMQAADAACYAAKEAGRNRVHTWFDTDQAIRVRHGEMQWASRMEDALDQGRFVLHAQRIHPLSAGTCGVHAEALIRLVDSDGSLVPPGAFLPATERFHLASRLDRWVLRTTLTWLSHLPSDHPIAMLAINMSGQSVGDRVFHRQAIEALQAAGPVACQLLCIEITETAAITNLADASRFIGQVRALGVKVALDDFGAGASSFGYLRSMRVDFLKIDGQFVQNLLKDPLDTVAVRCFVEVAAVVGVQTIAEFVDSADILLALKELGVNHAQGFLMHRPGPLAELLACLEQPTTSDQM